MQPVIGTVVPESTSMPSCQYSFGITLLPTPAVHLHEDIASGVNLTRRPQAEKHMVVGASASAFHGPQDPVHALVTDAPYNSLGLRPSRNLGLF